MAHHPNLPPCIRAWVLTMIDTTHNKANRKVYLLKKIRPYVSRWLANQIYKTCILPILDYADFLVDSGNFYNIDKFNSIQKRCLRIIDNGQTHGATIHELMGQYRHTELVDRRSQHLLSLMYRHAQTESNLDNYRSEINLHNNRKIKFKIPKTSLTKVNKSPLYRGVQLWNRLDRDVRRATTKVKFKTMLKKLGR